MTNNIKIGLIWMLINFCKISCLINVPFVEFAVLTVYTVINEKVSLAHIYFNMLMKCVDFRSKVYCDFPMECFHVTAQFVQMSLQDYESYFHSGFWPRQCTSTIAVQCSYTCCRCQYISP